MTARRTREFFIKIYIVRAWGSVARNKKTAVQFISRNLINSIIKIGIILIRAQYCSHVFGWVLTIAIFARLIFYTHIKWDAAFCIINFSIYDYNADVFNRIYIKMEYKRTNTSKELDKKCYINSLIFTEKNVLLKPTRIGETKQNF